MALGNVVAGGPINAIDVTDELDAADAGTAVWVDYSGTFTLTASSVNPTKGNSTYTAEYLRVHENLVQVRINLLIGSTFVAGTGNYRFLLPVAAAAGAVAKYGGTVHIEDSGTGYRQGLVVPVDGTTTYFLCTYMSAASVASLLGAAGTGTAWLTNDKIVINMQYEPA